MSALRGRNIEFLPEGCISHILSFTTPRITCRLSLVSPIFREAAKADSLWERFLPPDYEDIISRSVSPSPTAFSSFSKKDLYFYLCDHPILIDDGNKSFALDKWSGKTCYMIGARGLHITYSDNPMHWRWIHIPDIRFSKVAELIEVHLFEIHGQMETRMLSPSTTYVVYFVFRLIENAYGLEFPSAEVRVRLIGRRFREIEGNVYLDPTAARQNFVDEEVLQAPPEEPLHYNFVQYNQLPRGRQVPWERGERWMEVELGEFYKNPDEDGEVAMFIMRVRSLHSKSGLIIHGIELRPRRFPNQLPPL